jgi:YVTN family beta-propeller protein
VARRYHFIPQVLSLAALLVTQPNARSQDDDDRPAVSRPILMDDPRNQERINREIWESAKHTPYSDAVRHASAAQAASRSNSLVTLPTGWKLGPAGSQVNVGHLPFDAIEFNGSVVVLNTGYYDTPQGFTVVDPVSPSSVINVDVQNLVPGAAVGPGNALYIPGGKSNVVYRYDKNFSVAATYNLPGFAHGLAKYDDRFLAASYNEPTSLGVARASHVVLIDTNSGTIARDAKIANQEPYALAVASGKIYVTIPATDQVMVLDEQLNLTSTLTVGHTPLATCQDSARLYVVDSNSDDVSVIDTKTDRVLTQLPVKFLNQDWGAEPISCSVDNLNLYVTLAQANAIAVVGKSDGALQGYIPTGWYPTKVLSTDTRLMFVSARGIEPLRPNPDGTYVLNLLQGTLGLLNKSDISANLAAWTLQAKTSAPFLNLSGTPAANIKHIFYIVKENRTYDQVLGDLGKGNGDPYLTVFGSAVTPIQHYISDSFVTLDNTYVDGEVSTTGHSVTSSGYASPYLQMITSLDYSDRFDGGSDVDPGGYARTYLWDVLASSHIDYRVYGEEEYFQDLYKILANDLGAQNEISAKLRLPSLSGGNDIAARLSAVFAGHLPETKTATGLATLLRNPQYGRPFSEILTGDDDLYQTMQNNQSLLVDLARLFAHYEFDYPVFNLNISDLDRVASWIADFQAKDAAGTVEAFHYLILPNDHTAGNNPNTRTPAQYVAQNDAAFDLIMRTLAQSKIWSQSLVMAIEDDAQDGPDHVDATRTTAYVASPWTKRGAVVSDRFDQASLVRTVGLLLGVNAVSLNDAVATPMFSIFSSQAVPDYNPPPVSNQLTPEDLERYQELLGMLTKQQPGVAGK